MSVLCFLPDVKILFMSEVMIDLSRTQILNTMHRDNDVTQTVQNEMNARLAERSQAGQACIKQFIGARSLDARECDTAIVLL